MVGKFLPTTAAGSTGLPWSCHGSISPNSAPPPRGCCRSRATTAFPMTTWRSRRASRSPACISISRPRRTWRAWWCSATCTASARPCCASRASTQAPATGLPPVPSCSTAPLPASDACASAACWAPRRMTCPKRCAARWRVSSASTCAVCRRLSSGASTPEALARAYLCALEGAMVVGRGPANDQGLSAVGTAMLDLCCR